MRHPHTLRNLHKRLKVSNTPRGTTPDVRPVSDDAVLKALVAEREALDDASLESLMARVDAQVQAYRALLATDPPESSRDDVVGVRVLGVRKKGRRKVRVPLSSIRVGLRVTKKKEASATETSESDEPEVDVVETDVSGVAWLEVPGDASLKGRVEVYANNGTVVWRATRKHTRRQSGYVAEIAFDEAFAPSFDRGQELVEGLDALAAEAEVLKAETREVFEKERLVLDEAIKKLRAKSS